MSATFTLAAELRTDTGKGASRRLRHANRIPAIIYGAGKEPAMITFRHDDVVHACADEAFFSHILTLEFDGKSEQVIIKDMQRHPAKLQIMHADFQRIDAAQKLHVNVPLHFINEEDCPGVKGGGIISHVITELEIACLPKDLPEYIEIDMANLDLNESVHLSEIQLPEGVNSLAAVDEEHDQPVATVVLPRGETADEETVEDAAEGDSEAESSED